MTAIRTLAEYLSGSMVGEQSMFLALPKGTPLQRGAVLFFELRSACGVSGYPDADEAEKAIRARLNEERGIASPKIDQGRLPL